MLSFPHQKDDPNEAHMGMSSERTLGAKSPFIVETFNQIIIRDWSPEKINGWNYAARLSKYLVRRKQLWV